jgi:hypothetical protein
LFSTFETVVIDTPSSTAIRFIVVGGIVPLALKQIDFNGKA